VAEGKRIDPKRRAPASRPGAPGRGRPRRSAQTRDTRPADAKPEFDDDDEGLAGPIRRAFVASMDRQNDLRLGFTARRAAILAAVICVLTLTIAGPVRTYFAQRTEMKQLQAAETVLRRQIADLEQQKAKLADPVYVAAQARERLGFVMPGDIPYQVQLPPSAVVETDEPHVEGAKKNDPWYTALWHTVADAPHPPPTALPLLPIDGGPMPPTLPTATPGG
jgi:cell division protein DivIC